MGLRPSWSSEASGSCWNPGRLLVIQSGVVIVTALLSAIAPGADAALVGIQVSTEILSTESSVGHELPFKAGDAVVLRIIYDDSVKDADGTDGSGKFKDAVREASVELPDSGLVFSFTSGRSVVVTSDNQSGFLDFYGFGTKTAINGDAIDGDTVDGFGFAFAQSSSGGSPPGLVVDDRVNPPFSYENLDAFVRSTINLVGFVGSEERERFQDTIVLEPGVAEVFEVEPNTQSGQLSGVRKLKVQKLPTDREVISYEYNLIGESFTLQDEFGMLLEGKLKGDGDPRKFKLNKASLDRLEQELGNRVRELIEEKYGQSRKARVRIKSQKIKGQMEGDGAMDFAMKAKLKLEVKSKVLGGRRKGILVLSLVGAIE